MAEKQEDLGAPAIAAHIRSLTEPRSEEECQVSSLKYCQEPRYLLLYDGIELALLLQLASHMQLVQRLLSDSGERQGLDIFEVAEGLRKLGHAVTIRSALGGGGGNECLRNLRHRFLTCRAQGMLPVQQFAAFYLVRPSAAALCCQFAFWSSF